MNNVNATIMQSIAPFMPCAWPGLMTNNPVADASAHFDALADTFDAEVEYLGITFYVEVNKHSRKASEITRVDDGTDWYYEFSDSARRNIAHLAIMTTEDV